MNINCEDCSHISKDRLTINLSFDMCCIFLRRWIDKRNCTAYAGSAKVILSAKFDHRLHIVTRQRGECCRPMHDEISWPRAHRTDRIRRAIGRGAIKRTEIHLCPGGCGLWDICDVNSTGFKTEVACVSYLVSDHCSRAAAYMDIAEWGCESCKWRGCVGAGRGRGWRRCDVR